jgi:chromosomal replication initiator protein
MMLDSEDPFQRPIVLAGLLDCLDAALRNARSIVDVLEAEMLARTTSKPAVASLPPMRTLCAAIAAHHGLTLADMVGRERDDATSNARQAVMVALNEAGHSLPKIGRLLGGRDHSTILRGINAARRRAGVKA